MKRFFEEHTSAVIICIVVSLLLCIVGNIKGINSSETSVEGSGLLKIVGGNLTNNIDTYQKQVIPNKNLISNRKGPFIKNPRNTGDDYDNYQYLTFPAEIDNNKSYTFSANVEAIGNYDELSVMFLKTFDDGTPDTALYNKQFIKIPNNNNNRIKITLKNTDLSRDFNAIAVYSGIQGYTRGQGIKVWNVKLEEGTKTTPYEE